VEDPAHAPSLEFVDSIDELGHHVAAELAGWRHFGLIGQAGLAGVGHQQNR